MNTLKAWSAGEKVRGQSIVEFALILPILMLLMLGIVAFGQLFSYKLRLDNAVREAARAGAVGAPRWDDVSTGRQGIETIARNRAGLPGSNDWCTDPPAGAPCIYVTVLPDDEGGVRDVGGDMIVTVRYDAYVNVPIVNLFTNPVTIYARRVMRIESLP